MSVDKNVMYFKADVGKKVYEIEHTTTYVTKWQVVANNEDEAFDTYLEQRTENLKTEDGNNCVCSSVRDFNELGKTKEIATVMYNKEEDEVYCENK